MTKKLQVGLIGCGRWGRLILRDLLSLGCDVLVVTPSEIGQKNARDGGARRIVEKIADLPPVPGLIVATPTNTHAAVIESPRLKPELRSGMALSMTREGALKQFSEPLSYWHYSFALP